MAFFIQGQTAPGADFYVATTADYLADAFVPVYQHVSSNGISDNIKVSHFPVVGTSLSTFELRQLFTPTEKILIDNVTRNQTLPADVIAAVYTIAEDMRATDLINLSEKPLASALIYLESVGLIATGRAAQINAGEVI